MQGKIVVTAFSSYEVKAHSGLLSKGNLPANIDACSSPHL